MPVATTDAFRRITVQPDNVTIVAEQVGDTLTLVAGSGISLVANAASDQITIVNTGTVGQVSDTWYQVSAGTYSNAQVTVNEYGQVTSIRAGLDPMLAQFIFG